MLFSRIISACKKVADFFTSPLRALFAKPNISASDLAELRELLLKADVGRVLTDRFLAPLERERDLTGAQLGQRLHAALCEHFQRVAPAEEGSVIMMMGVNGSGKTTTTAKLAARAQRNGKRVLLVAADTFRAAATEQLIEWAQRLGVQIVHGADQDPGAVVFRGCQEFLKGSYDLMIIDTAGRLQTDQNLMAELAKVRRVIAKQLPNASVTTYLTIDSMLGQNSLVQAQQFHQYVPVSGIILTKFDGTGKGGIACAIVEALQRPIQYVATGETIDALAPFDTREFVSGILGVSS